jgi:hypothetical protein
VHVCNPGKLQAKRSISSVVNTDPNPSLPWVRKQVGDDVDLSFGQRAFRQREARVSADRRRHPAIVSRLKASISSRIDRHQFMDGRRTG